MANVLVNEQYLKDIADAVRSKLGTTEKMLPSNMARHIDLISAGSSDSEEALMFFLTRTEEFVEEDDEEYIANEDEIEKITNFNWPKDLPMIGSYAFYYSVGIAVTSLPDSIKKIGDRAFYQCKNLALTSLPENVLEIGHETFYGCENITLTSLPKNITKIGDRAFYRCKNLALTSLPENVEFGYRVFWMCEDLALTSLPENMTKIDSGMFGWCTNLALTSLPPGLTEIGSNAFTGCEKLAFTSLPENITSIGWGAFSDCTNLALTSLPPGLTEIEDSVFRNCSNLALTSIPKNITRIGCDAFAGCTCFTDLEVSPDGPEIQSGAFRDCTFETVTINGNSDDYPYELTYTIQGCIIDKLILNGNVINNEYNNSLVFWWLQDTPIRELVINFDDEDKGETSRTSLRNCFSETITFNKYYYVHWESISDCPNLTTVNFKDGAQIRYNMRECNMLNTINIYLSEQNVTEILGYVFNEMPSLNTLNIIGNPEMITIDEYAFGDYNENPLTINVSWSEGEVANAPWGASNATINYNYTGE